MELVAPVVLATAVALAVLGWRLPTRGQLLVAAALLALLGGAAALALTELHADDSDNVGLVLAGALAVVGGGVVTSSVFGLVDGASANQAGSVGRAGEVLRGGAWIGALERCAVFVAVVTEWPEGLAVTLALKGLGRYPELRTETPGAAERFIIGTFTSVLWAVACAGAAITMR
jgi:hypothetical protein